MEGTTRCIGWDSKLTWMGDRKKQWRRNNKVGQNVERILNVCACFFFIFSDGALMFAYIQT
jgi:hypothetical protein